MNSMEDIDLTQLKGVGKKLAETLGKLAIFNLQDLLFHLPFRYEDRTRVCALASFRPGSHGLFEAEITSNTLVYGRRRSLEVKVRDQTSSVILRFYHFNAAQAQQLAPGLRLRGFGEARLGRTGIEFYHPEYQVISAGDKHPVPNTLTPIYPLTEGIQQARLRSLFDQALTLSERAEILDLLPPSVRERYQLPELKQALRYLHRPPTDADQQALLEGRHPCQQRLIVEELLAQHLSLLKLRIQRQAQPACACQNDPHGANLTDRLLALLPFALTQAQQHVTTEIARDLARATPMLRLLQGDVGSGKTVVAALAALQVIQSGGQVALMAPTEILAEQHFLNFSQWLEPLNITLVWLSGKSKGKIREQTLQQLSAGEAQVVIGTHALFQPDVRFKNLVLVIVDEQHRFGVHQRLLLKNKGPALNNKGQESVFVPHQLIMTATPIPRTLAMSAYADLDTSVIDELPPGRQAIETFAVPDSRRAEVVERVIKACQSGSQAYWVCTLIEDSEVLQCQAAEETATWLQSQLGSLVVGLVHGRMKTADKTLMMEQFKVGKIDVLVATTVIEVGVDVPNAGLIIIENPERLGLAQLHQLRGRVGRGQQKSYCALMYHPPLSNNAKERLRVLRESTDGFVIAEKDLQLRGPGEVLGTRQTGLVEFKIADLQRDQHWLPEIKNMAALVVRDQQLTERLIQRWVGHRREYGEV